MSDTKCTCGPHRSINEQQTGDDRCPALAYHDGVAHIHPLAGWTPEVDSLCLRCDTLWLAGATHVCADYTDSHNWKLAPPKLFGCTVCSERFETQSEANIHVCPKPYRRTPTITASSILAQRGTQYEGRPSAALQHDLERAVIKKQRERLDGITNTITADMFDPVTGMLIKITCPTCQRPIAQKGNDSPDFAADSAFVEIVTEFMKVDHLGSAQDKVERLSKIYRFARREPITSERED